MFLANVLGNVFFCSGALCWAIVVTLAIPLFRWGDGVLPLNTGGPHGYLLNSPPTSTSTQSTGTSGGQGGGPRWACSCPPHPASSASPAGPPLPHRLPHRGAAGPRNAPRREAAGPRLPAGPRGGPLGTAAVWPPGPLLVASWPFGWRASHLLPESRKGGTLMRFREFILYVYGIYILYLYVYICISF